MYLTNGSDYCESSKIRITYCIVCLYAFLAIVLPTLLMHRALSVSVCVIVVISWRKSPLISTVHRSTDYLPLYFLRNSWYRRYTYVFSDHVYLTSLPRFNEPNHIDRRWKIIWVSPTKVTFTMHLSRFLNVTQCKISRLSPIYSDLHDAKGWVPTWVYLYW